MINLYKCAEALKHQTASSVCTDGVDVYNINVNTLCSFIVSRFTKKETLVIDIRAHIDPQSSINSFQCRTIGGQFYFICNWTSIDALNKYCTLYKFNGEILIPISHKNIVGSYKPYDYKPAKSEYFDEIIGYELSSKIIKEYYIRDDAIMLRPIFIGVGVMSKIAHLMFANMICDDDNVYYIGAVSICSLNRSTLTVQKKQHNKETQISYDGKYIIYTSEDATYLAKPSSFMAGEAAQFRMPYVIENDSITAVMGDLVINIAGIYITICDSQGRCRTQSPIIVGKYINSEEGKLLAGKHLYSLKWDRRNLVLQSKFIQHTAIVATWALKRINVFPKEIIAYIVDMVMRYP